jgi:hypothetical protein
MPEIGAVELGPRDAGPGEARPDEIGARGRPAERTGGTQHEGKCSGADERHAVNRLGRRPRRGTDRSRALGEKIQSANEAQDRGRGFSGASPAHRSWKIGATDPGRPSPARVR